MRFNFNNYYRKIKALFPKGNFLNRDVNKNLLVLLSLFLISTLAVMLFAIYVVQGMLTNSYQSSRLAQERFHYWMERVDNFPNSPDVLYNAAVNSMVVGKDETALELLQRAIERDPLFVEAKNLRREILENAM